MLTQWAKRAFLANLEGVTDGALTVECPDRAYRFGHARPARCGSDRPRRALLPRALTGSEIGIGEAFMDGDWTTPDIVPLVRLMLRNRARLDRQSRVTSALQRLVDGVARRLRDNSVVGSRRHIHRHYDLGNDFFRLFLDADLLMYSCGCFESAADSLEQAQARKVDHICRTLKLSPDDHVLEIGSGWGGFAVLGSDSIRLPGHDHDDQRRTVPPCHRLEGAAWRGRIAHRRTEGRLSRAEWPVRQGGQHRDVRGGGARPLRRLLSVR